MGVKDKDVVIDGCSYTIRQLGAREGRRIWLKLLKVLAEPLKLAAEAEGGLNEVLLVKAAASLVEAVDDELFDELCEVFGKNTTVLVAETGKRPELIGVIFDQHFAGNYVPMTQWVGECILFNFGSFLGEASIGGAIDRLKGAASKLQSPPGTTGTSTGSSPTPARR